MSRLKPRPTRRGTRKNDVWGTRKTKSRLEAGATKCPRAARNKRERALGYKTPTHP